MIFGTEKFYRELKAGVLAGDPLIYEDLDRIVEWAVRGRVRAKVIAADVDDVLQEIKLKVYRNLVNYLRESSAYAPAQRDAWLWRIVNSVVVDYYRRKPEMSADTRDVYAEDYVTPEGAYNRKIQALTDIERFDRLIGQVCCFDMAPGKIIAFLYNRVICPVTCNNKKKGSPKALLEELGEWRLCDIRRRLLDDLSDALGRPISPDVLQGLDSKLETQGAALFRLDERGITDASYEATRRIRKTWTRGSGGQDDE